MFNTCKIMDTAKGIYAGPARNSCVQQPPIFLVSKGWGDKFMVHHKVKSVKISGELTSGDKSAAREYLESLKNIIEEGQYTPNQIFNMDETNF